MTHDHTTEIIVVASLAALNLITTIVLIAIVSRRSKKNHDHRNQH